MGKLEDVIIRRPFLGCQARPSFSGDPNLLLLSFGSPGKSSAKKWKQQKPFRSQSPKGLFGRFFGGCLDPSVARRLSKDTRKGNGLETYPAWVKYVPL